MKPLASARVPTFAQNSTSNLPYECPQRTLSMWVLQPGLHAEMQRVWPLAELNPGMFRDFPVWHWNELFVYQHGVVVIHEVRFLVPEDIAKVEIRRVHVNPYLFANLAYAGLLRLPSAIHRASNGSPGSWLQGVLRATSQQQAAAVTREKDAPRATIGSPKSSARQRFCVRPLTNQVSNLILYLAHTQALSSAPSQRQASHQRYPTSQVSGAGLALLYLAGLIESN